MAQYASDFHEGQRVWVIDETDPDFGRQGTIVAVNEADARVFLKGDEESYRLIFEKLGFEAPIRFHGPGFPEQDKIVQIVSEKKSFEWGTAMILYALSKSGRIFERFNEKEWTEIKGPQL